MSVRCSSSALRGRRVSSPVLPIRPAAGSAIVCVIICRRCGRGDASDEPITGGKRWACLAEAWQHTKA
jgi:hypothetical protein